MWEPQIFLRTLVVLLVSSAIISISEVHAMIQTIDGKRYYVHPFTVGSTRTEPLIDGPIPALLVSSETAVYNYTDLCAIIERFSAIDDVFTHSFASNLITQMAPTNRISVEVFASSFDFPTSAIDYERQATNISQVFISEVDSMLDILPSGPYFIQQGRIHQAWRLYEDELDAFTIPVVPDNPLAPESFQAVGSVGPGGMWKEVAVPSRLYHIPDEKKPLTGKRISLKDIFHLKGIKTTFASRDWTSLHGPEETSADYVNALISMGAIIVGKTATSIFAGPDMPTDQWIDFHCPFNPRGAGASLAGYDWLDISIGSDSGGSIRAPATDNGLYGLRTSWNLTSMNGIEQASQSFDVVGLLGRSLEAMISVAEHTFPLEAPKKYPTKIIYPTDFFPHDDEDQQQIVEKFVSVLEHFLGTKRVTFSIFDQWDSNPPKEADGKKIMEYLEKSAFWPYCYEFYHSFDKFRALVLAKYGRQPYAGPAVQFRWDIGSSMTAEESEQGQKEQSSGESSDAIMIMPYGSALPIYRDVPNEPPTTFHTLTSKMLAPVLQIPQLVFPIWQKAYYSRISNRTEYRPIACTLVGARGSDLMLLKLGLDALRAADWPTEVLTGRYMWQDNHDDAGEAMVSKDNAIPSSKFSKAIG